EQSSALSRTSISPAKDNSRDKGRHLTAGGFVSLRTGGQRHMTRLRVGRAGGPGVRSPAHARGRTSQHANMAGINAVVGATTLQQPRMGLRPDTRTTDPTMRYLA